MTPLEHFEKRVKQHTEALDARTKDTALIWDLWRALQETIYLDRAENEIGRLFAENTELRAENARLCTLLLQAVKQLSDKELIARVDAMLAERNP